MKDKTGSIYNVFMGERAVSYSFLLRAALCVNGGVIPRLYGAGF